MRKLIRKPHKFEESIEEPVKKKKIILYKKQKCDFINPKTGLQCKCKAVGRGNMCVEHGGERSAPETLITTQDMHPSIFQKYDPNVHPLQYILLSKNGMSDAEIASELNVGKSKMVEWTEKYFEFAEAYEIGQSMQEAWWLETGKNNLNNRFFQTGLYKFITMNKLGYSEKASPVMQQNNNYGVLLLPPEMSIDEWEQANIKRDNEINQKTKIQTIEMEKDHP